MSRDVTRRLCALILGLAIAGCNAGSSPSAFPTASTGPVSTPSARPSSPPTSTPPSSPSVSVPASPVEGLVTTIDATGLDKVSGFTLRTAAGDTLTFTIGTLENGAEFPPGHLKEHQATSSPVRVFFRPDGSDLVVYRIEDAG